MREIHKDKVWRKNVFKALYDKILLVLPNQLFRNLKLYGGNGDDGYSFQNTFIPEQNIAQGFKLAQSSVFHM